jgi:hypothetical protein
MNKNTNIFGPPRGQKERMTFMRKLLALFTIMAMVCIPTAFATSPPGFTGRVIVESKTVLPGASFTVKVWLDDNNYPISSIKIPLKLSSSHLTCTYVDFAGTMKLSSMEGYYRINGNELEISYIPSVVYPVPYFGTDSGLLATLYFTASAGAPDINVAIDSVNRDSIVQQNGSTLHYWTHVEMADTTGAVILLPDFTPGTIMIRHSTDIATDDNGLLPTSLDLAQNFPNPFNPTTTVSFSLPEKARVRVEVYNLLGQNVATLADADFTAGNHSITWDATGTPSGLYFYRLTAGQASITKKMLLLK